MDPTVMVSALVGAIVSMAGFIVLLYKGQLADKDRLLERQGAQIERQQTTLDTLASGFKESLETMVELQTVMEAMERELAIRKAVERRKTDRGI